MNEEGARPQQHAGDHDRSNEVADTETVPADRGTSDEAFRLTADRPRAVRLSRRAITILASAGCVTIAATLLYALQSKAPGADKELLVSQGRPGADNITSAPDDYAKVPKLGAPLPGDLGRPILSAQQRRLEPGEQASGGHERRQTSQDPAEAARERRRLARDEAISSKIFSGSVSPSPGAADPTHGAAASSDAMGQLLRSESTPASENETAPTGRQAFLAPGPSAIAVSRHRVQHAPSSNILQAGSIIPAALITGISSDLPGQITAQVTENVYDSPTGQILLIPQGARLIGQYDSATTSGQRRVLFAWDRMILPNGSSVLLDRLPGADGAGRSGLEDRTDNHWDGMLGAALISTLLGVGTELATDSDDALVQALRYGTQDTVNQTGRQVVQRQLAIPPTLKIRPGHPLRVIVTRDLILEP